MVGASAADAQFAGCRTAECNNLACGESPCNNFAASTEVADCECVGMIITFEVIELRTGLLTRCLSGLPTTLIGLLTLATAQPTLGNKPTHLFTLVLDASSDTGLPPGSVSAWVEAEDGSLAGVTTAFELLKGLQALPTTVAGLLDLRVSTSRLGVAANMPAQWLRFAFDPWYDVEAPTLAAVGALDGKG